MRILRPPRLRRGDVIGICAPASAPASADALDAGIRYFEQLGYRVELGKNLYRRRGYLAERRAARCRPAELFQPPRRTIFTARGGYGAHRIREAGLRPHTAQSQDPCRVQRYHRTSLRFLQNRITSVSGAVPSSGHVHSRKMFGVLFTSPSARIVRGTNNPAHIKNNNAGSCGGKPSPLPDRYIAFRTHDLALLSRRSMNGRTGWTGRSSR